METSRPFAYGDNRRIQINKRPHEDLQNLNLDAVDPAEWGETSAEEMPRFIVYNDQEGWFWKYGKENLYAQVFDCEKNPECDNLSWGELHCFVTNYAWVDPKWRFLLDKPCWPLHTDVVDLVVMLYRGRKHYEENQTTSSPREMLDVRELSRQLFEEAKTLLGECVLITVTNEGEKTFRFMRHECAKNRGWIPSMLHRVLEFKDSPLPPSPVMMTAFGLDRFDS